MEEVLPAKPEFVKTLEATVEKAEGSNVHLEAQVNPVSDHTMNIEWFKDGHAITGSSRIGALFSFGYVSLNINGLRSEDAGTYICRATNAAGEASTQVRSQSNHQIIDQIFCLISIPYGECSNNIHMVFMLSYRLL